MEELIAQLKSDPDKALKVLTASEIDPKETEDLRKEYKELDRDLRDTQVKSLKQNRTVGPEGKKKVIKPVKYPIPFQNKIVTTSVAFEIGEPVTIIPNITNSEKNKTNKLTDEISRLWKVNRLDSIIQKAITAQKKELQCAILFYMQDLEAETLFGKWLGINNRKEIKIDLLENKNGAMSVYKDSFGDMKAFTWKFKTKEEKKDVNHAWVYTDKFVHKLNDAATGKYEQVSKELHGFNKIPVVYFHQDQPEWKLAEEMIDRIENVLSNLGDANDYYAHPILKLYGTVQGAPNKDEVGKVLRFEMEEDEDEPGKIKKGDADYLERENAAESVELELDRLEKYIYSLTSTPDLSLENLKSIGDISGKAIKLLFLDAIIKAKMNEGDNRTAIERIINVFISGIITTTGTALKSEAKNTYFDIQFNSILPDDLKESVETFVSAVNGKIMSVRTAVENLGMTDDVDKELEEIAKAGASEQKPGNQEEEESKLNLAG